MTGRRSHDPRVNRELSRRFVERRRAQGYTPTSLYLKAETKDVLDRIRKARGFSNRSEAVEYVTLRFAELGLDLEGSDPISES